MVQAPPAQTDATVTLRDLVEEINRYELVISEWDTHQQAIVNHLKNAIETLHKEALARIIRSVKQESMKALRNAVEDEVVYGVLRYHDLVKVPQSPLVERIQHALAEVRPMLQGHHGDVELVAVRLPDTVEVRLIGTCSNCPASALTLSQGVEQAIKQRCPEIEHVVAVSTVVTPHSAAEDTSVQHEVAWRLVTALAEIPDGGVLDVKLEGHALLFSRHGMNVTCFHNACSHLGVPLDGGEVKNGIITCPYHHFRYHLATGECLTVREVPLQQYPVRVDKGRVFVQLQ